MHLTDKHMRSFPALGRFLASGTLPDWQVTAIDWQVWQWAPQCIRPRMCGLENAMLSLREEFHSGLPVAWWLPASRHVECAAWREEVGSKGEGPRSGLGLAYATRAQRRCPDHGSFCPGGLLPTALFTLGIWAWEWQGGESALRIFLFIFICEGCAWPSTLDLSSLPLHFTADSELHQVREAVSVLLLGQHWVLIGGLMNSTL